MAVQIQMRRDVAADWTSANPVLAEGELGLETDTAKWKIGDGATAWTSLGYANQVVAGPASVSNSGASPALTITNTGSGNSLVVEDSASTDSTPFVVTAAGDVGIGTASPAVKLDVVGVVAVPLGSAALPSITPTGDTDTGIWSPAADTVAASTGGTQRMAIDSSGRVVIGGTASVAGGYAAHGLLQLQQTAGDGFSVFRGGAHVNSFTHAFHKTRNATPTSHTIVASGDAIGQSVYFASDGAGWIPAAIIRGQVDGTPGLNDMPGALTFHTTADGAASPTERMRINNAGLITGTGTSLGAWTAYTPTASAGSGTATTVTAAGRYTVIGKTCTVTLSLAITNKGTAGGAAVLTLPFNAASGYRVYCGSGRENGATGGALQVVADAGANVALIFLANGGTPWVDTYLLLVTMTYEIA